MSLVLEALTKQEAGSDPGAAVSLARSATLRRRHRLWVGLFAVAMAINAALVLWVFGLPWLSELDVATRPEPSTTPLVAETPQDRAAPARPDPVAATPRVVPAPSRTSAATPEQAPAPKPAAERRPAPVPLTRVALRELPDEARARFPGIAFSTHIYTEDADLRAVVANGRKLKEGDSIRGLEIIEITDSGVLVAFGRYRVDVPIVTDWDAL
jgi:general secretion pathway protein B